MKHLLVVDLEATCWNDRPQSVDTMEVIEIGVVQCDLEGRRNLEYSQLVRPEQQPRLSTFCTELTGITQSDVDSAPVYSDAIQHLNDVLESYPADGWCSWGDYDRKQLCAAWERSGVKPNFLDLPHYNLRRLFQALKGSSRKATAHHALRYASMTWEGDQHRALSDAINYSRLVPMLFEYQSQRNGLN